MAATAEADGGLKTPASTPALVPETAETAAKQQTLLGACLADTFDKVDEFDYQFACTRAFATVLWDQNTFATVDKCMDASREHFAASKTEATKFSKYIRYANTPFKRELGEVMAWTLPAGEKKRKAEGGFNITKKALHFDLTGGDGGMGKDDDVEAGEPETQGQKRLRTQQATLDGADQQLKINEQRKVEERLTEALKSIPPTAQDFFLFLTAVKPLVDASASFAKDVVEMLEDANKEEDADETSTELLLLSKGNVKGLEKVAELAKRAIKDMVLQHLVKGGSYALLQASRKNETFSVLGVEISDEIKKEARELQSDFGLSSRENAYQRKPYDKGRGHDTFHKGGRDLGSAYAKAKSAKCDRCGCAGHLRSKCWAEKHTDGRALGGARRDTDRERGGRGGGRGGGADRGRTDDRARDGDYRRGSDRDYKRR